MRLTGALVAAGALALSSGAVFAQAQATYLYNLSGFGGPLEDSGARVRVDQETGESYVLFQNIIRIYSPSGMEVFSFGEGLDLGQVLDVAVDRDGDIFLLSYREDRSLVTRCTYRGVPIGPLDLTGLPEGLVFSASRMMLRNGSFYFASPSGVLVTNAGGGFQEYIDLRGVLGDEDRPQGGLEVLGFTVDPEGSLYFTVPTLFRVFKYAPDGTVTSFGQAGSAPGRFGVVAGITSDSHGNLLVTDRLRCVVMVFDRDFDLLTEFGYRGLAPDNLVVPNDVAVDRRDRVYVSQARRRGVSVFAVVFE